MRVVTILLVSGFAVTAILMNRPSSELPSGAQSERALSPDTAGFSGLGYASGDGPFDLLDGTDDLQVEGWFRDGSRGPAYVGFSIKEWNPVTQEHEERVVRESLAYEPYNLVGLDSHTFYLIGYAGQGRGIVVEEFSLPKQRGGYISERLSKPAIIGQPHVTLEFAVEVIGGGLYVSQSSRPAPIPTRRILHQDASRFMPQGMAVDPDGRFLMFATRDDVGLSQLNLTTLEVTSILDSSQVDYVVAVSEMSVSDCPGFGRTYELLTNVRLGSGSAQIMVFDTDNDGKIDGHDVVDVNDLRDVYANPDSGYVPYATH